MTTELKRYDAYRGFFSDSKGLVGNKDLKGKRVARIKYKESYAKETYPDLSVIEHESAALYQVFLDSKHKPEELRASGLIEMLAFSSQLLLTHYESYPKVKEVECYEKRLKELDAFVSSLSFEEEPNHLESRCSWIVDETKKNNDYLWALMCQPGIFRDQLGWTNLTRIFWIFYHFSLNQMMLLVKDAPFLDTLGKVLGRPIDLDAITNALNMPNDVLNILSVSFFGVRLLIDVIMLAKHTYSDEGLPADFSTTPWQRFVTELDKRACNITNCIVWGAVNAATNYSNVFGIPTEFAMPIVAGVLTFDLGLSLVLWYRERVAYDKSFQTLATKINELNALKPLSDEDKNYLKVLTTSLDALKEKWSITNGVYQFNSAAALTMMVSFTTSLLVVNPVLILACYLVCCFSLSLYSSAAPGGEYSQYLEASHRLAYAQSQSMSAIDLTQLADDKSEAWSHLVSVLFERAFVPLALFTLTAINPILGLTTMITYLGYKLYAAYDNAVVESNKTPIALNQFSLFKGGDTPSEGGLITDKSREQTAETEDLQGKLCA